MLMLVFWAVMQCGLVGSYQRFGETYCLIFRAEFSPEDVSPKRWYLPASPQGVTTQKTNINTFTALRTSNIIKEFGEQSEFP
jgi:hypothetical protein